MREVTIRLRLTRYPTRGGRVNYDPREIMDRVGRILQRSTKAAFREQSYGGWRWPEVYEGSRYQGPFINIAGALQDFTDGLGAPRSRQFEKRPALVDGGDLSRSTHVRMTGPLSLEQYSTREDAKAHMNGLTITMPISQSAKEGIRDWLFVDGHREYASRLNHLRFKSQYVVKLHARPFMGVTDDIKRELEDTIARYFAGRVGATFEGVA